MLGSGSGSDPCNPKVATEKTGSNKTAKTGSVKSGSAKVGSYEMQIQTILCQPARTLCLSFAMTDDACPQASPFPNPDDRDACDGKSSGSCKIKSESCKKSQSCYVKSGSNKSGSEKVGSCKKSDYECIAAQEGGEIPVIIIDNINGGGDVVDPEAQTGGGGGGIPPVDYNPVTDPSHPDYFPERDPTSIHYNPILDPVSPSYIPS